MISICIFGLGYVGLPLALNFSKKFNTVGFDISTKRIRRLKKNIDDNNEFSSKDFKNKKILFSSNINHIKKCNYYIVCVPTPINLNKKPDLSALKKSFSVLKVAQLVIIALTNKTQKLYFFIGCFHHSN